jgi:hypothetical protein
MSRGNKVSMMDQHHGPSRQKAFTQQTHSNHSRQKSFPSC